MGWSIGPQRWYPTEETRLKPPSQARFLAMKKQCLEGRCPCRDEYLDNPCVLRKYFQKEWNKYKDD